VKYPNPLNKGSKIAITAFLSGVSQNCHQRLGIVLANLKNLGYEVVEGQYQRKDIKHASASKHLRVKVLMSFV